MGIFHFFPFFFQPAYPIDVCSRVLFEEEKNQAAEWKNFGQLYILLLSCH